MTITNNKGVTITDSRYCGHCKVDNAKCWCGETLLVAPRIFNPEHEKGNPEVVCVDFGHTSFWFKDLILGEQVR